MILFDKAVVQPSFQALSIITLIINLIADLMAIPPQKHEKKYSFWERITGDTPSFFKKIQILGAGLVAVSVSLTGIGVVPVVVTAIMASVGTTMGAIAQLAVKQADPVTSDSAK